MNNGCFDLTGNAFYILKTGYRSKKSEIADLVDDAESDEVFEPEQIQRAQQSLLAPMARLEQEISWLPELSQSQISNVLSLIKSADLDALIESSKHTPELAKANILAHFCGTGIVNDSLFHALVAAWGEVDQENIHSFVDENRENAGFPAVDTPQICNALKNLENLHARTAAFGVWTLDRPGDAMDRIVEAELSRHPSSSFLEKFVRGYDTLSEPALVRVNDEIDRVISCAKKSNADLVALVTEASDLLVRWDEINQPVQVYEQYQGHEEGRSKRVFEKLRSLCLDLANNRSEFAEARRLSEALLRTFPELESVAEVLKGDVAQLETLDEQHQHIDPLVAACEAAKNQMSGVKSGLARYGFSQASKGPVSDIFSTFKTSLSAMADKSLPYMIVRDLALFVNNDHNDPETAFRLVDGLLSFSGAKPSSELVEKLAEERAMLHRNWKMGELDRNKGNTSAMSRTVDEMLKYARGNDKTELLLLKSKIEQKSKDAIVKWVIIGVIILLIGIFGG
jgi:hypothetical protein